MDNNLILKKLRIALNLKEEDIIEIMGLAGYTITPPQLSALFRRSDHRNYRGCGDQILEKFLDGLILKCRGDRGEPESSG